MPQLNLVSPASEQHFTSANITISFEVCSETPITYRTATVNGIGVSLSESYFECPSPPWNYGGTFSGTGTLSPGANTVRVDACDSNGCPFTTVTVYYDPPVASVVVTNNGASTLRIGETTTLTARTYAAGGLELTGRSVTWTSSVVQVSPASGSSPATTTATATTAGNGWVSGTSEGVAHSANIQVMAPTYSVTVTPTQPSKTLAARTTVDSTYFTVRNASTYTTSGPITFTLTAACSGVASCVSSQGTVALAEGAESGLIKVLFNVSSIGTTGAVQLTASATSPQSFSGNGTSNLTPTPAYSIAVNPASATPPPVGSGTSNSYGVTIVNTSANTAQAITVGLTTPGCANVILGNCSVASNSNLVAQGAQSPTINLTYDALSQGAETVPLNASGSVSGGSVSVTNGSVTITVQNSGSIAVSTVALNPRTTVERGDCLTIALGQNAAYECGDLRVVHALPTTTTMGNARTPTLIYNSRHAKPGALLTANVTYSGPAPLILRATVTIPSHAPIPSKDFIWNSACNGQTCRIVFPMDILTDSTRLAIATLQVEARNGGFSYATSASVTDTLVVVSRTKSPFGAGWWLDGLERFSTLNSSSVLWVGGDGSTRLYRQTGDSNVYTAGPAYDRPDTLKKVGSVWQRMLGDSAFVEFDDGGHHLRTVNALGWVTTFAYNQTAIGWPLQSITLPVPPGSSLSRVYTFNYALNGSSESALTDVTAPPDATARTVTTTRVNHFQITGITDPVGPATIFSYEAGSNRMALRRNKLNDTTSFLYDDAGALKQARISMARTDGSGAAIVTNLRAAESRSAYSSSDVVTQLAKAYTLLDGPRSDVSDTTVFFVNRWGAPDTVRNALGHRTRVWRNAQFPALVDSAINAVGFKSYAKYNSRALLDSVVDVDPIGNGQNARTEYTWHPKWVHVVAVKHPSGVLDSTGYSSAVAIPLWAQTGPDSSRRVNFAYNTRNQVASVRPPGHSTGQLYTYAYDSQLGNLQEVQSPFGRLTTIYSDVIGRDTLTRTPLEASKWLYEFRRYDKRDLITRQMTTHDSISGIRKDSAIVANTYDDEGSVLSVATRSWPDVNAIDTVSRIFTYDPAFRRRSEALVGGFGPLATTYDAAGNVLSGGREAATYTYDVLSRPLTRTAGDVSTFTYDSTGLRTANNPYAQVKRSYYRNGALKTDSIGMSVSDTSLHDFSQKYGLTYTYDLSGRRTAVSHPVDLVPVTSGQTGYAYSAATGELATVTDVFGNQFAHTYDGQGRLKTLTSLAGVAQQIVETRWYDVDGQLAKRVAGGSGAGGSTGLRNDTITYDYRGKALGNGFHTASYTPLGYLRIGDLGGGAEVFAPDALGNSAGGLRGNNNIINRFQARTGRVTFTEEWVPGGRDTTLYYYTSLGAQGDKIHIRYLGGSPPNVQQVTRSELHTYTADNKLAKVFVQVDSTPPPLEGVYKPYRFEESYRYDALGRRIESRLWRTTNCPSKDPDSGCQNTLTRTIWDGSQILYELRWVFAAADTIPGAWSTGNGVPGDATYWGTVGYTHGLGIDQPLALFKGTFVVVPHANWRGMLDQGTCPTTLCPGNDPAFPGKFASAYGATTPGLHPWYGTLIGGMTDASSYLYRRNRYVDPSNGRFTQEDPIGLAGGLNLYGFANGDPVNFSDPFGLCPWCAVAYAIFEIGSTLYDVGDLAITGLKYASGRASGHELAVTGGGAALGLVAFGGGYGSAARGLVKSLDDLSTAARVADRGGLTAAGRALTKHARGQRGGSRLFPELSGNVDDINRAAGGIVDDILTNPKSAASTITRGRFKGGVEIYDPSGRGLVYDAKGNFITLAER